MQMGTIWDYSINISHCISRDFLPNAMFGSRPQRSKKRPQLSAMLSWNAGDGNARLRVIDQTTYPEQGFNCSQVISRKGSQPPSEAEYLRAVNQRWVQTIVKPDQHQHRKDARRQRRDAVHLWRQCRSPAEGISQSSPGTADSGEKSTRTTKSGWQKMTSRHRRASTTSTPRSARDVARSGNARRSHRSPRRTPTGHRTPRAVEDKHGRESSDVSAKRRSTEARGSSEPIAIIEELREQCQTLREKVAQTEMYAASRDQVIKDIEAKFTEYLRGHNQQVFNEI